ncbi:hypothetical protein NHX12_012794 [Muraenolepis orangiensis]|uniref:RNA helicase n=1 Tax=Muraenolepis orangiensis TaxID=630683 RepID=A0A9Q0DEV6_9TELE|nr:hypothetical protein NHX12_012794 [Muraenolepis orangiensis]
MASGSRVAHDVGSRAAHDAGSRVAHDAGSRAAHDVGSRQRTDDVLLADASVSFASLLLSRRVLDGLTAAGFHRPSPIQLKAVPLGRCGLDLIVQAKSGTGKTCVFSTIALDSLVLENHTTQVLVLAPTREIAVQIHSVLMAIGSAMEGLRCHVFIGGTSLSQDKVNLKKCHIAVGSPGRIKQLIELGTLSTASIRLLVLDEADKLLEEGSFQEQINWIFSSLPATKQMLALSATYPESLAQHLTRYMREPTFVRLNPTDPSLKGLRQYYQLVNSHSHTHKVFEEKVLHLLELFSKVPFNQALVFSNLHSRAQHLADILSSKGLPAVCISGGLSQDQRLEAMSKLKQYQCRVLISTDLTSRGIDAEKVNLVINLDIPQDWETYMHRIGRAGRFGTQGLAVTYCCHGEEENKMMAMAQRCRLKLNPLPSPIDAGLMEESCDWGVSLEASAPGTRDQLFPKQEKKKNKNRKPVKAEVPDASFSSSDQEASSTSLAPPRDGGSSGRRTKKSRAPLEPRRKEEDEEDEAEDSRPKVAPPPRAPTRKELQEALPKIPPLNSFKTAPSDLVTLEEAQLDFRVFITEGPGRSVEVIRQFKGQSEDGGQSIRTESHMLHDPGDTVLTRTLQSATPALKMEVDPPPRRSASGSSNSSDEGEAKAPGGFHPTRREVEPGPPRTQAVPPLSARHLEGPDPEGPRGRKEEVRRPANPSRGDGRTEGRKDQETEERRRRRRRKEEEDDNKVKEMREEDSEEEAEAHEWSNIADWRAYYRSWEQYYESMAGRPHPGYHGYYRQAHSWMASYRMNAVYINELLRNGYGN